MSKLVSLLAIAFTSGCAAHAKPVEPEPLPVQEEAPAPLPEELPGLDANEISPVVKARYPAVGGCHTIELGPSAQPGTMTVDWVINPDGSVTDARVTDSSFDNERVADCVLGLTEGLRFPKAPGSTEVSWRFRFRGS